MPKVDFTRIGSGAPILCRHKRAHHPVWVTQDERKIAVCEMDARHLDNAIAYLDRRIEQLEEALDTDFDDFIGFGASGDPDDRMWQSELYVFSLNYKIDEAEHWLKIFQREKRRRQHLRMDSL